MGTAIVVSGVVLAAVAATGFTVNAQQCPVADIERVSIPDSSVPACVPDSSVPDCIEGNDKSVIPALNANGCVVAFKSYASNLVVGDTNEKVDVFVRDRVAATTERIPPVGFTGAQSNDNSYPPGLDASGNLVAFGSLSNNLVPGDFNQVADMFVYNRGAETTGAISLALGGEGGGGVPDLQPSVSADGNLVVFTAASDNLVTGDHNQATDVILSNLTTGALELISQTTTGSQPGTSGNGPSAGGAISADGCHVAFYSDATNIVAQDKNQHRDVFVRDRCAVPGSTERVSVASDGTAANADSEASGFLPAISTDGNRVAFSSDASNLDPSDDNGTTDIFVRDRAAAQTMRVSKAQNGDSANGPSQYPSMSADGRFVVFQSDASNLVDGDTNRHTDIFVVVIDSGDIRRVSLSSSGAEGNGDSTVPQISADGTTIVFQSEATNLVDGDTNGASDIFVVGNPLSSPTPTPTPTAGDSCGAVCAVGQGCRRDIDGTIQAGECVPDRNCQCIVGGTETPTASFTITPTSTATPIPPPSLTPTRTPTWTPMLNQQTPTPTAGDSCGAVCSVGQGCRRQVGGQILPGECVPDQDCLCIVGGTATATPVPSLSVTPGASHTPTATLATPTPTNKGGGGGGGCGCRIDPATGRVADSTPLLALVLPAGLWTWRRRQRRS